MLSVTLKHLTLFVFPYLYRVGKVKAPPRLVIGVPLFTCAVCTVREVPLEHPDYPEFAKLGLKWGAVPSTTSERAWLCVALA